MRYVTTSARRNLWILEFLETPTVNRSVIFRNLVDPKRGIVLSHEPRIRVTPPAHLDHLGRGGLADVSLRLIHGFQSHLGGIPTVTGDTAKSFRRVDVRLVQFDRLRQLLHAECRMAKCASFSLRLSIQNGRGR